jgi:ABC-2 type transport system permease protein
MTAQPTPQPPAPPGGWQAAADPLYNSPIPIRKTHLGHAITSEWTKIRSVRSTMWTLGLFVVVVVGVGLLFAADTQDTDYANVPYTVPAFFGLILGQICLITLGVLVVSSEYGTGMIRTTFTASPQRYRVLTAKILVFFCVSLVVSMLSVGLVGLLTSQIHHDSSNREWLGTVFRSSLYVSLMGVLALAMGSILRHSAGAITAMLGLVLVPAILPVFLAISRSTREIGNKVLEYSAPNSLAKLFHLDNGSGTPQFWLLAAVTGVAVAAAYILLDRRDV